MFGFAAFLAWLVSGTILGGAIIPQVGLLPGKGNFGDSWVILGGFLAALGHLALIMALATHLHGVNQGYRKMRPLLKKYGSVLTLEAALLAGVGLLAVSGGGFLLTGYNWAQGGYAALNSACLLYTSEAAEESRGSDVRWHRKMSNKTIEEHTPNK